jgi:predicted GNAT family N-acyltransferase
MEKEAEKRRIGEIALHARETAVGFYEKLGYVVSGERFTEVGIPHWYMQKNMNR